MTLGRMALSSHQNDTWQNDIKQSDNQINDAQYNNIHAHETQQNDI